MEILGLPSNESIKSFSSTSWTLSKTSTWRHFSYTRAFSLHVYNPWEVSGTTPLNHYSHWEQGQRLLCWRSFEKVQLQLSSCFWWGDKGAWIWGSVCLCFRRFMAEWGRVGLPTSSISSKSTNRLDRPENQYWLRLPLRARALKHLWCLRKSKLHNQPRWQHLWWRTASL